MAIKRTTSKVDYYRAPCPAIDQILLIKKLTNPQAQLLYANLKAAVAKGFPGGGFVQAYIKILIKELLKDPDLLTPYIDEDTINEVLKEVYECIVDIYITFRIEVICADLNNIQPRNPFDPIDASNFDYLQGNNPTKAVEELINRVQASSVGTEPNRRIASRNAKGKANFSLTLKDLQNMEYSLKKNILGQDQAIECLINRLKLISVGFDKRGAFFFIGRTGVGKTELAKLFGKRYHNNFAKINCGEFTNGHEVAKLVGAPPGYMGSSQKSFFLEKSEISNRWVFLFDEIEKAHEKLFNLLLSLLDDGTITDSNGHNLDFTNSIFIFTSNQGLSEVKESTLGFSGKGYSKEGTRDALKSSLDKQFTPEFRNRIDEFIYFNDLTLEDVRRIVILNLKQFPVVITDALVDHVVSKAYSLEYGVRELKRFIKTKVALLIANAMLASPVSIHTCNVPSLFKYTVSVKNDELLVEFPATLQADTKV
jgi:ATP-dependent Clp protease ATP-binding subunit ClpA